MAALSGECAYTDGSVHGHDPLARATRAAILVNAAGQVAGEAEGGRFTMGAVHASGAAHDGPVGRGGLGWSCWWWRTAMMSVPASKRCCDCAAARLSTTCMPGTMSLPRAQRALHEWLASRCGLVRCVKIWSRDEETCTHMPLRPCEFQRWKQKTHKSNTVGWRSCSHALFRAQHPSAARARRNSGSAQHVGNEGMLQRRPVISVQCG